MQAFVEDICHTKAVLNIALPCVALACAAVLLWKKVRTHQTWRATVTPLASIIGSGFLVVVPLLGHALGAYAPVAMLAVVVVAYIIGAALRFNILHAEPLLAKKTWPALSRVESASDVVLGLAYFISVAFYLRLLSAFALRGFGVDSDVIAQSVTTGILAFIGIAGWVRGLDFLEKLEAFTVSIKLAIIAALIVGWAVHDVGVIGDFELAAATPEDLDAWYVVRLLAGVLIVVQGFETSRYLGDSYDAALRVKTMRGAQLSAALIYVIFVALCVPELSRLGEEVNETAIIDLSAIVAGVLAPMLVLAAVMSQLSAAVADTVGAGGLFSELIGKRFKLSAKYGYVLVAVVGIVLVWTADVFQIISLASRAFAVYYGLQCIVAAMSASRGDKQRTFRVAAFGLLAALLFFGAAIAIPAG